MCFTQTTSQVSTKWDTGHDETDNTLSPEPDTGLSQNGETDSYTTANITDGESYHINQAASEAEKTIDAMEDVNAYIEIIKENIEYDHYMKYSDWQDRELYDDFNVCVDILHRINRFFCFTGSLIDMIGFSVSNICSSI